MDLVGDGIGVDDLIRIRVGGHGSRQTDFARISTWMLFRGGCRKISAEYPSKISVGGRSLNPARYRLAFFIFFLNEFGFSTENP